MSTLSPPPGFRGLDPNLPITRYVRHLPHWRQEGATYFVTFNLGDALPQPKLKELKMLRQAWENERPRPRSEADWEDLARRVTRKAERWMDSGYGACHFRRTVFAHLLHDAILFFHEERYEVFCFSVMPNHCHCTLRPHKGFRLEKVVGSWKDHVAKMVNRALNQEGSIWQQESYDRIVRDEDHLQRIVQYIGANHGRAGIPRHESVRWMHPEWEDCGWRFEDE